MKVRVRTCRQIDRFLFYVQSTAKGSHFRTKQRVLLPQVQSWLHSKCMIHPTVEDRRKYERGNEVEWIEKAETRQIDREIQRYIDRHIFDFYFFYQTNQQKLQTARYKRQQTYKQTPFLVPKSTECYGTLISSSSQTPWAGLAQWYGAWLVNGKDTGSTFRFGSPFS